MKQKKIIRIQFSWAIKFEINSNNKTHVKEITKICFMTQNIYVHMAYLYFHNATNGLLTTFDNTAIQLRCTHK